MANILPAILDQIALGDIPNEQRLRTIVSAALNEQKETWKALKSNKAERVYGKPTKSDCVAMYLDRDGKVQSVAFRMWEENTRKDKGPPAATGDQAGDTDDAIINTPKAYGLVVFTLVG